MGTKERRQRQLAERELLFLSSARELIRDQGLLNLQMSRVAERSEYAVGTLYQHFASKEDLLLALATDGMQDHVALFERAARWEASPRERMLAIAVADTILVHRCPEYFRVAQYALCEVVWRAASGDRRETFLECGKPIGDIVIGIVDEAVASGDLVLNTLSPKQLMAGFWAQLTGTHDLVHAEGLLEVFSVNSPYRLMCQHLQCLMNGYGWQPLVDPGDMDALDRLVSRIKEEVFHDLCHED